MIVDKIISDDEIKLLEGEFIDYSEEKHKLINEDTDVFIKNEEEGGYKLLFCLRKNVIPKDVNQVAKDNLLAAAKTSKTNNRGISTGRVDLNKMGTNVAEILDPGMFQTRVRYENGTVSDYKISNKVRSMIAGYYDVYQRKHVIHLSSFSESYPKKWNAVVPYVEYLNEYYSYVYPEDYKPRKEICKGIKFGLIGNTVFSTLTLNYNFRTALHKDKGDTGLSLLTTLGSWKGCYLGYPQFGYFVNVEEGDFFIMNPHEYHCNSHILDEQNMDRLSIVTYCRARIISFLNI